MGVPPLRISQICAELEHWREAMARMFAEGVPGELEGENRQVSLLMPPGQPQPSAKAGCCHRRRVRPTARWFLCFIPILINLNNFASYTTAGP